MHSVNPISLISYMDRIICAQLYRIVMEFKLICMWNNIIMVVGKTELMLIAVRLVILMVLWYTVSIIELVLKITMSLLLLYVMVIWYFSFAWFEPTETNQTNWNEKKLEQKHLIFSSQVWKTFWHSQDPNQLQYIFNSRNTLLWFSW